jgi:NAD(P)-dependent dehydrogenase (short-subunit alcohol dehydrogenase family)
MTPESTGIHKTPPEQSGRLAGQVAIVTGGTSGIGQQACLALAREGAAVVVVGRDSTRLSATVAAVESVSRATGFSRRVLGLPLNVCQAADMESMARQTLEHFGRIDILIASAGILRSPNTRPTRLLELSTREWDKVVETNLTGVFLSNRAVLKTMREQRRGQIINISSLTGRRAVPFDTPYSASKFGVMGLTAALAQEMMPYGVRVQVLLPGDTATPIWAQNEPLPPAAQTIPASRVADLIVFMLTWPYDSTLGELAIAPLGGTAKVPWRLGLSA